MRERRKERIAGRMKQFMQKQAQNDQSIRPRIDKVLASQDLFDQVFNHTVELAKSDHEMQEVFEGEGDDIPHPILQKLVDFFIANWKEILTFIMSLFMNPGGIDIQLATEGDEV